MLRDVYWRQYPVDLLSDDKMAYIETLMPEGYEYAPYMFYITALKLADDDGIFDLADGIIFARLMRVKDVSLVIKCANLMRRYKIIYRLSDDQDVRLCGLVDWTYSDKKKRTMDERRRAVAAAIERERAKTVSSVDFPENGCAGKQNDVPQSASCAGKQNDVPQAPGKTEQEGQTAPQSAALLCPDVDKKAKNVVINAFDDKNAENVTDIQTDNTDIHTNSLQTIQESTNNTHTQLPTGSGPLEGPPPVGSKDSSDVAEQYEQPDSINTQTVDANSSEENVSIAEEALILGTSNEEKKDTALFDYLEKFFVKNCYGYKPKQSANAIRKLIAEIMKLSDEVNPPLEVASVLCGEFKKMCDGQRGPYWKGQLMLPAYMLKPRCWMELLQYAEKILATSAKQNKFVEEAEKVKEQAMAEREAVLKMMDEEYAKYQIDPNSPNAAALLLMAKNRAKKAEPAEKTDVPEDIF